MFNPATGTFQLSPSRFSSESRSNLQATDNATTAADSIQRLFSISVLGLPVNNPPVLSVPGLLSIQLGLYSALPSQHVTATDATWAEVTLSAQNVPNGAQFNPATVTFCGLRFAASARNSPLYRSRQPYMDNAAHRYKDRLNSRNRLLPMHLRAGPTSGRRTKVSSR